MADPFTTRKRALSDALDMADEKGKYAPTPAPKAAPAPTPSASPDWQRQGYKALPEHADDVAATAKQRSDREREDTVREKARAGRVISQEDL
jgi:hypothetical protein